MNLAVNYSPQAAELLTERTVTFDLFKCPDWDYLIAEAKVVAPLYVHFRLLTGQLSDADLRRVEAILTETATPYVNVHLHATTEDFPAMKVTTKNPGDLEQVTEWLIAEVEKLTRRFGAERVIAENLVYRGHGLDMVRPVVLPEVIRTVLATTGCNFLLDVSHARIAAYHLGVEEPVDVWGYLDSLPVDRLRELHLTGIRFHDERLRDHFGFGEGDRGVLERVFNNIRTGKWAEPGAVAFEYGGVGKPFAWRSEKEVLARDLPRLWNLVIAGKPTVQVS